MKSVGVPIEHDTFIQSGNSVTIDTTTNPDWSYILCWIKLDTYNTTTMLFRGTNLISRVNINKQPTHVDFTFNLHGDIAIEIPDSNSVTITAQDFGEYNTTPPITFTKKDNDPDFGIAKLVIV
ncbi:106R [Cherax quadricarinatus iridovirus]|nr:106R [Cherax quadricarinatus iridovirus]UPA43416.1 106R [Iridovirus CN01]ASZ85086.1 106R [Cherax quadricarinatus iridovirus]UPA43492.1 106R [Iridovirus CN01]UPA43688.1 106R [Iridovirus CN01]UPA43850.1 106R [Iridovirus CN01]